MKPFCIIYIYIYIFREYQGIRVQIEEVRAIQGNNINTNNILFNFVVRA